MTLVEKLDRLPPCFVRILAKHNGNLMTDSELVSRTGWSKNKLRRIYTAATWKETSVGDADLFIKACGLKWSSQRRQRWLIALAISKGGIHTMRHLKPKRLNKAGNGWRANQLRLHLKQIEKAFSNVT